MAVWTITGMMTAPSADGLTNVVQSVDWVCTDTDGINTAIQGGKTPMDPPTASFTPYDQLSEAQVVGWVQSALGVDQVSAIEQGLNQQIVYMQSPPVVVLPLPWGA